ncbi:MAG: tetratricopeptide repeat protein, partial [Planctomycetota bacterium]|nr:tetratricopeptide repeat protein [Planctomycetota bacterium]
TLYHALTGHTPFRGRELYQVLDSVVNKDPIPPTRFIRNLPRDLETICLKCMQKDPASRYQSARALSDDLTRLIKGEVILARPISSTTKLWRKAMKNKIATIGISAATVILIAVVIGLLVSSARTKREIELYHTNIKTALAEKDIDKAKEFCHKLLTLSPDDRDTKGILRRVEDEIEERETKKKEEKERSDKERERLEKERQETQASAKIREKAKATLDRTSMAKTSEEKIKIAEDALKIDPTYGDAYQVIGYIHYDNKEYDRAYEALTKAIELNPTLAYSYYRRGYITAYQRNNLEGALPDFEMVLKYDPTSPMGYFSRGLIKCYQKDYDSAIADYSEAVRLDPKYADAYKDRGAAYYGKGDLEQAIADFNKAIELNPKS